MDPRGRPTPDDLGRLDQRGAGPLQQYAARRVAASPAAPRDAPLRDIVALSYGSWAMRVAAGLALILGLLVVAAAVALWRVAMDPLLLLFLGLLFGVGIPLVPLVAGLRARSTIRRGELLRARVVEISERATRGDGPDAPTRVVGVVVREVADGTIRTRFDVEAPWALDLEEGDTIVGLAHGERPPLWLGTPTDPPDRPDRGSTGPG